MYTKCVICKNSYPRDNRNACTQCFELTNHLYANKCIYSGCDTQCSMYVRSNGSVYNNIVCRKHERDFKSHHYQEIDRVKRERYERCRQREVEREQRERVEREQQLAAWRQDQERRHKREVENEQIKRRLQENERAERERASEIGEIDVTDFIESIGQEEEKSRLEEWAGDQKRKRERDDSAEEIKRLKAIIENLEKK